MEKFILIIFFILVVIVFGVIVFGTLGGFEHWTSDGTLIVTWREVTPPRQGLTCKYATIYGDNVVWCEVLK